MKKLFILSLVSLLFLSTETFAQNYKTAIGVRGGFYNGITVKHFTGASNAIEGLATSRWNGFNLTLLWDWDNQIADVDGLSWFYGIGGHIGTWDNDLNAPWYDPNYNGRYTIIGIDGIIGLEFTIPNAPINFQLDYKPIFDLVGYNGFRGDVGALSIRYAIK